VRAPVAQGSPAAFESEHLWGPAGHSTWEPALAVDPNSRWIYQMTTEQLPGDYLLFRSSGDGGATWNPVQHLCLNVAKKPGFQYDPELAVAGGTIYAICLNDFDPGIVFTRSQDHGTTWSVPARLDGSLKYSDKPILLVSPAGKDVYVGFSTGYALHVAASHDGGTTWSAPVRATTPHLWYYPYGGALAPDGSIWFSVDAEAGVKQTGDGRIGLVTSSDGGKTWSTKNLAATHEGEPCPYKECYPDFFTGQAAVGIDRAGSMVFAYAQNLARRGPNALYVMRSHDGRSWSAPLLVSSKGNNTSPALAAGPTAGDFRLVWQDNRNGHHAWNTWYARSTDAGATWSAPVRLSDRGSGAAYKHAAGYDFPGGDYLGLTVDANGVNHVVWGEGSGVYTPAGTWWTRGGP
jgi:hypothetical protein